MNLTNIISSILFAIIDVILIEYFLHKTFHYRTNHFIILYIIEILLLFILHINILDAYFYNLILLSIILSLSFKKYNISIHDKIKIVFLFLGMEIFINNILEVIFTCIFNTPIIIRRYYFLTSYKMLLLFFFRYIELIVIIYIINKRNTEKIQLHYFKIISVVFSIYFLTAILLNNDKLFYFTNVGRTFVFMVVVYNIAFFMFDRYQRNAEDIEKELLITKQNIELEEQYIKEVGEKNRLLREFRHNLNNKATIITGLIHSDMKDEAIKELEEFLGETVHFTLNTYVDNVYVDTIIDAKVNTIKEKGFEFNESYGIISMGSINASDLALALALAMDNAIEAVDKIHDAPQRISLDIRTHKNYIILTLTNSIQPGTKVQFSHTSKSRHIENHGFGVKKIKSIAETYNGEAHYEVIDDCVVLKLFMSIDKDIEKEKA